MEPKNPLKTEPLEPPEKFGAACGFSPSSKAAARGVDLQQVKTQVGGWGVGFRVGGLGV